MIIDGNIFLYGLLVMCYAGRVKKIRYCEPTPPSQRQSSRGASLDSSHSSKTSLQRDKLTSANGGE